MEHEMNLENLELVPFGSDILNTPPDVFNFDEHDAEEVCSAIFKAQKKLRGAGLSANQVGLNMRIFTFGDGEQLTRYIINPEIVDISEECVMMSEGCLSLPGVWLNLKRPKELTARYQTTSGEWTVEKFTDIAARVFLHEYDHMLGQNFTQRASKLKLSRALKKVEKRARRYIQNQLAKGL